MAIAALTSNGDPDCSAIVAASNLPAGVSQLLVVGENIAGYTIRGCRKYSAKWYSSFSYPVSIGRNGIAKPEHKLEGDLKTPSGLYSLGTSFGISRLKLDFPYRKLTASDKFIDDQDSSEYNSWVRGYTAAASYEPLLKYYRYGIVINYNMNPVIKGKGSAIFIHNWNTPFEPTSGCVAMAESNLLAVLNWLHKKAHPHVLILEQSAQNE